MAAADLSGAYRVVEEGLRSADRIRHLATFYAPAPLRRHVQALYAFDAEIAGIRRKVSAPMPGEVRIQWWREVFSLERLGEAEANPLAAAVMDTVAACDLPTEAFQTYLDARADALYDDPLADMAAVEARADAAEGTILRLAARILGATGIGPAARHAGIAIAMATGLRDLAVDIRKGRLALPLDLLERNGLVAEDLLAGKDGSGLVPAARDFAALAGDHAARAREAISALPEVARPAFLALADVAPVIAATARSDYAPFDRPIEVPAWRRLWALWRAARG